MSDGFLLPFPFLLAAIEDCRLAVCRAGSKSLLKYLRCVAYSISSAFVQCVLRRDNRQRMCGTFAGGMVQYGRAPYQR